MCLIIEAPKCSQRPENDADGKLSSERHFIEGQTVAHKELQWRRRELDDDDDNICK